MKIYDRKNNRIAVFEEKATDKFWDKHWMTEDIKNEIKSGKNNILIKKITNKFLQKGSMVLEGGCGNGRFVYGLTCWGYDAYGIDYAEETVKNLNKNFPGLKIYFQDVKNIEFPDNFFDGYWSMGVIEHFYEGYENIIQEAERVIKSNGYLFLTFPQMSFLRIIKSKLNLYKEKIDSKNISNFYQFILDPKKVVSTVEGAGFELLFKKRFDATKGLKDEVKFLRPILQSLYNSKNIFAKVLRLLISFLFSGVAGHSVLLVFKKS